MFGRAPRRGLTAGLLGSLPRGLYILVALALSPWAHADEPRIAIRLADEQSAIYAISEVERFAFEGEDTLRVITAGNSDSYPTDLIQRIEFLWDFSSAPDPTAAAALIEAIHLFQNQPNPFDPETRIGFHLPLPGHAELVVYGPDGRRVRSLLDTVRPAGHHEVTWDGHDDAGRQVAGGIYFYSLRAAGIEESRRMILIP